jgi:hypothetical protein
MIAACRIGAALTLTVTAKDAARNHSIDRLKRTARASPTLAPKTRQNA